MSLSFYIISFNYPLILLQAAVEKAESGENSFNLFRTWSVRWDLCLSQCPHPSLLQYHHLTPKSHMHTQLIDFCTDKHVYSKLMGREHAVHTSYACLSNLSIVRHTLLINQMFLNLSTVSSWMFFLVLVEHPTKSEPVGQYSKGHATPCQFPAVTEHQHI